MTRVKPVEASGWYRFEFYGKYPPGTILDDAAKLTPEILTAAARACGLEFIDRMTMRPAMDWMDDIARRFAEMKPGQRLMVLPTPIHSRPDDDFHEEPMEAMTKPIDPEETP